MNKTTDDKPNAEAAGRLDGVVIPADLWTEAMQFVHDMQQSTKHAALLGCGQGLDERIVFREAAALHNKMKQV